MVPIFRSWLEYSPPSTDFLHDVMLVCIPFVSCTSMLSHLVHLISRCLEERELLTSSEWLLYMLVRYPETEKIPLRYLVVRSCMPKSLVLPEYFGTARNSIKKRIAAPSASKMVNLALFDFRPDGY